MPGAPVTHVGARRRTATVHASIGAGMPWWPYPLEGDGMSTVTIAGQTLTTDAVRDSIVDYARRHHGTLQFVDRYAREVASKEPGSVVPNDIVMLNVFNARPSADLTVELLTTSHLYDWDRAREHAPASLSEGPADSVSWANGEGVASLRGLFVDITEGVEEIDGERRHKGASRKATASKLLYVRWPDTVPVVDSRLEEAYGQQADQLSGSISSRIIRRWAVIRDDVRTNAAALSEAAESAASYMERQVSAAPSRNGWSSVVAADLRQLSPLRLLDIVVWSR